MYSLAKLMEPSSRHSKIITVKLTNNTMSRSYLHIMVRVTFPKSTDSNDKTIAICIENVNQYFSRSPRKCRYLPMPS